MMHALEREHLYHRTGPEDSPALCLSVCPAGTRSNG